MSAASSSADAQKFALDVKAAADNIAASANRGRSYDPVDATALQEAVASLLRAAAPAAWSCCQAAGPGGSECQLPTGHEGAHAVKFGPSWI